MAAVAISSLLPPGPITVTGSQYRAHIARREFLQATAPIST
jgi:hypothetical protein